MPAELDDTFDLMLVVGSATVNESESESRNRSKQDARRKTGPTKPRWWVGGREAFIKAAGAPETSRMNTRNSKVFVPAELSGASGPQALPT
jgi:hypothetical protein